ncbi:MAG: hypothetical protein O3C05_02020, partial [Proteobacteria bacterium]|nr:hypothetical protein [Pseudomonadota bacterium]
SNKIRIGVNGSYILDSWFMSKAIETAKDADTKTALEDIKNSLGRFIGFIDLDYALGTNWSVGVSSFYINYSTLHQLGQSVLDKAQDSLPEDLKGLVDDAAVNESVFGLLANFKYSPSFLQWEKSQAYMQFGLGIGNGLFAKGSPIGFAGSLGAGVNIDITDNIYCNFSARFVLPGLRLPISALGKSDELTTDEIKDLKIAFSLPVTAIGAGIGFTF